MIFQRFSEKSVFIFITALLANLSLLNVTEACTRVLFAIPGHPVLVGNNMDWPENMQTDLMVFPRGSYRASQVTGNALGWKSQYGSIITTVYGIPEASNGINERGFAAHVLGLAGSDYGVRDDKTPGLSIDLWAQFYLDNFQTVDEAVKYTQTHPLQVVTFVDPRAGRVEMHLAMEDATGDSAIIEYIDGKPVIYHDRNYKVLTNQPTYDKQLENMKQYVGLGGDKPIPGTTYPIDRFVRASYYLEHMSNPKTDREAIFKLLSIMQNAGQPYGTITPERQQNGIIYESIWRSISDLTNHVLYFNSTMRFNMFWVKLDSFNLEPGAPIMKLDLQNNVDYVGDVSGELK